MATLNLHYSGSFVSREGHTVRAEIWAPGTAGSVGDLTFNADEPVVVEWGEMDKETTLMGSSATITIISPGDRTYSHLYTTAAGSIWLRLYRDGRLFWTGSLDTEFYEEPYSAAGGYEVSLTFSDLGLLSRLTCDAAGVPSVLSMVSDGVHLASGLAEPTLHQLVSTTFADGRDILAGGLAIRADNFTDEDGETETWHGALEGVLRPLDLHLRQWGGAWWLFDLNSLATPGATPTAEAYWTGDDAMLSVDKVANSVTITFSPYAEADLLPEDGDFQPFDVDTELVNTTTTRTTDPTSGSTYYTFWADYAGGDIDNYGFTFHYGLPVRLLPKTVSAVSAGSQFRIVSHNTGSDCQGVALLAGINAHHPDPVSVNGSKGWTYMPGLDGIPPGYVELSGASASAGVPLFIMRRVFVPARADTFDTKDLLRIQMEMMIDARYNPFEAPSDSNSSSRATALDCKLGYVFMPFTATIYDAPEGGNALCHYENHAIAASTDLTPQLGRTLGEWKDGAGAFGQAWLQYYDSDDRAEKSGVSGWKTNRPCIGLTTRDILDSLKQTEDGQYIPLPPHGGYLQLEFYKNVVTYDFNHGVNDKTAIWFYNVRWWLVKYPTLDIQHRGAKMGDPDDNDIEQRGTLDPDAKEDISIDTICGTAERRMPSARGVYLDQNLAQVSALVRAGRTTTAEQLLIGTMHSQFASRHTLLSGTIRTSAADSIATYTDRAQPAGTLFMLTQETANLGTDESEVKLCELTADIYTAR